MSSTPNEDIRKALATHFSGLWAYTSIVFPNVENTPPVNTAWVRFNILPASTARQTMTGNSGTGQTFRGVISIQIFTPRGSGDEQLTELLDNAYSILNEKTITADGGQITTGTPASTPIFEDGAWLQANSDTPFLYRITQ